MTTCTHRSLAGLAALALASVWLAASVATAQEASEAPVDTPPMLEVVDVSVVNVQVFVTDRDGNAITGLQRDDFEVFEDGKPVEITNFFAVADRRPVPPPQPETPTAEPAERAPMPILEMPEDQRLYLILFIDNVNIRPPNRRWVGNGLRRFVLNKLSSEDRVMVVSYDRDLNVRQPFTSDTRRVLDAIDEIERVTAAAVTTDAERRRTLSDIENSTSPSSANVTARFHASYVFNEMSFAIAAMKDLVRDLAGLPGRKALVHVSDGLPLTAAEDVFTAVEVKYGLQAGRREAFDFDLSRRYRELTSLANASDVTFYTLDAKGLGADSTVGADETGTRELRGLNMVESTRFSNLVAPLQMMAADTGGQAIFNTNALDAALGRVAEDFTSFYSLGYHAPNQGDDRHHKIEVRLKNKPRGYRVRHREGYRDKRSEVLFSEGSIATLHYGVERNALGVEVELGRAEARADGNYLLPLLIKIPLSGVTLAPGETEHFGRVRVATGVKDSDDRVSPVQVHRTATIRVPNERYEEAQGKYWTYELQLVLSRGRQRLTVGVHDELGAQSSFLSVPVNLASAG